MKRTHWPTCLLRGEEGRAATFHRAARRERAMRVWGAMQAVLAVAAVEEVRGSTRWDWLCIFDSGHPYVVAGWAKVPE